MTDEYTLTRTLNKLLKEPDNHVLYNDIGVMLYELQDYKNAEMYLKKAFALSDTSTEILYNYAHALYACNQWRQAVEVFKAYLSLVPSDSAAQKKAADAYFILGEYELAAKYACLSIKTEEYGNE